LEQVEQVVDQLQVVKEHQDQIQFFQQLYLQEVEQVELEHQQEQLKQEVLGVEQMEKIMVHLQVQQVILHQ
jgi:hypothetical protein